MNHKGSASSSIRQQQFPQEQQQQPQLHRQQLQQQQPLLHGQQQQQMQQLQKQQEQQQPMPQQSQNEEWFTDEDESVPPAATTGSPAAYVLYDFEAKYPEELSVTANDDVMVIEDPGNGWLLVNRGTDSGYIPSAYVRFY